MSLETLLYAIEHHSPPLSGRQKAQLAARLVNGVGHEAKSMEAFAQGLDGERRQQLHQLHQAGPAGQLHQVEEEEREPAQVEESRPVGKRDRR